MKTESLIKLAHINVYERGFDDALDQMREHIECDKNLSPGDQEHLCTVIDAIHNMTEKELEEERQLILPNTNNRQRKD